MKLKGAIWTILLTLLAAASSHAWQNPAGTSALPGPSSVERVPPQAGPQGVSPYVNRPPVGYQPPLVQPQDTTNTQDGWPSYPYPQHHNPYYEGQRTRNLLTDAVDWIMAVPSNVMGNFCDFLDRRVFPQVPATHGGAKRGDVPDTDGQSKK
ncbi:MAG: hypothetical protein HY912_12795 [Desulfomonile tiedjei]|uniref:Uncharacterized protein n=1 Tax=Desulfomonile tiedjei TaxID=2358 RepID=A0A9D6Z3Z2_9BACT|nr:hypothetical protein [Desulfomonile tiedjei]